MYIKVDINTGSKGLFGYVGSGGTVKNLGVSGDVEGGRYIGGVASNNEGTIENCYFTGDVTANDSYGGGMVGSNSGTVKNCYNTAYIKGYSRLGGIVGENNGIVEICYNTGDVYGTSSLTNSGAVSGGIVGYNTTEGTVKNCYNIGTIRGKYKVGGVNGRNDGTVTSCYYLKGCNASGTTFTNTDGTLLTAAQMQDKSNYSGWDFSKTWYMTVNRPLLRSNFEITLTPTTDKYDLDGDDIKDTVYEISTADEFVEFGAAVNNGNRKLNAVLTKDIDLSGYTWSPIGVYNSDFEGIFDGQNHAISNMKFITAQHGYNYLTYDYQGLFGVIRNGAIVRNFTLKGDITLAANGQEHIGGVVGLAYGDAKILNVTSYVNITDGGTVYSDIKWIGGVVGQIGTDGKTSGYVDWCKYYGTINVDTAAKVGGIVGCAVKDSYVTNSTNYGKVGWNYIGHIAGVVGSATTGTHVVNCANYGEVSADCHDCIGGVVGYANEYVTINNCLNGGKISGQPANGSGVAGAYIGGILGYINNANFAGLTNCFNYGTVKNSGGTDTYIGALVGWLRDGATTVKDNYYLATSCAKACGTQDGTNNTAVTAKQAASGEIAYKLQGSQSEQVWGQTIASENYDVYPVLGGTKVYSATKCNGIVTYANAAIPTSHSYSNGVCQNCGASQTINQNSDGYYKIGSKADYINFTNSVNGGNTQANAVLTADIDLAGYDYIPIGIDGKEYKGTFDGAGHKIENLTMTVKSDNMGMFGKTNGATVKNFTVNDNITAICNAMENIGGVIGKAENTTVSDVISKVNLKDNGKIEHIYRAGGITAWATNGSQFENCEYSGDIALHYGSHTTGIVGVASDASKDNPIVIKNCVNRANMKFDTSRRVAGIVGWVDTYTTVLQCANYGNITIKESDGMNQTAGIVAVNIGPLTVEDCANYGNITDGKYNSSVGGIVGYLDVSKNIADFGGVKNSFNYGTITNTNENGSTYWGSVIGYIKNDTNNQSIISKTTNNYYLDGTAPTVSGTNGISLTATKVSADAAANGELAYTLQGTRTDNVWGQTLIGNDVTAYPVPNGDKVYKVTFVKSNETYATKYANETGIGTLPESPGDGFTKWLCGKTADSAEFTAKTPVKSDLTVYAFKTDTPQASETSDRVEIMADKEVAIDLRNYVKSAYGSGFAFSVTENSTLPQGLSIADDGYTIVGKTDSVGTYTVSFNVKNNNISLFSINNDGTILTLNFDVTPPFEGGGTSDSPYLIKTTDDLINFRDQVTGGCDFSDKVLKLAADIDLNGNETNQWTPIGTKNNQFEGTFDGDGHKISGLYIKNQDVFYQGLFGYVGTNGEVKNLNVYGAVSAWQYVGGVVGYNDGTVANCTNYADVSGACDIGGVVGFNDGTVANCTNYVDISGMNHVGGVIGFNDGMVTNCVNYADVRGENDYNSAESTGGVVGFNQGKLKNSYNMGDVSGNALVGGVTGKNNYSTIENCYNTGDVRGITQTGGVAGYGDCGDFINSYNIGKVSGNTQTGGLVGYTRYGKLTNCYNTGNISGNTQTGALLGAIEEDCYTTTTNCYYLDACAAYGTTFDNTEGRTLTAEQMKIQTNFTDWDFENTWTMNGMFSPMLISNPEKGTKNTADVVISTLEKFKAFRDEVNGGNTFEGKYIILTGDIDLNGNESNQWTPISTKNNQFKGTFDGNGHKISGLYINNAESDYQGLFAYVGKGGTVKNLNVYGAVSAKGKSGGVAGCNYGGAVKNCANYANVSGSEYNVGGVVGDNVGGTVKNCTNHDNVSGTGSVGGVVGYNSNGTITNSSNTGNISGVYYVGGVGGLSYGGKITNSYNEGNISGTNSVGGVIGDSYATVTNCYNTGCVDGTNSVGGVAGDNSDTIENCYNTGSVSGTNSVGGAIGDSNSYSTAKNCYNTGSVSGTNSVGGVTGEYNAYSKLENCYYLDTCEADDTTFTHTVGTALTAEKMKDALNYENWDFENTWTEGTFSPMLISNLEKDTKNTATVIISTVDELKTFRDNVNNGKNYEGEYIFLTADLDLEGSASNQWTPIGTNNNQFEGTFNGDGHKITGLFIMNTNSDYQGLFCSIALGGSVKNLNADGSVIGHLYVGGIAAANSGVIENCSFTGNVSSYANGGGHVGGIAGLNVNTIKNCHTDGSITCAKGDIVGSMAGDNNGIIENCYNTGSVQGVRFVGGIAGYNYFDGTVKNCYNTGSVYGNKYIGGITGYNNDDSKIENCYNTGSVTAYVEDVGGIAGRNDATITSCYYLNTCGASDEYATALTAVQMKTQDSFKNWDFAGTWVIKSNRPFLKNNLEQCFEIKSGGTNGAKTTATVFVPRTGTYTVVFADYENGRLNNCDIVSFTATADKLGENTVTSTKEITLGKEDKIMLWDDLKNLTPLCDAYEVK